MVRGIGRKFCLRSFSLMCKDKDARTGNDLYRSILCLHRARTGFWEAPDAVACERK